MHSLPRGVLIETFRRGRDILRAEMGSVPIQENGLIPAGGLGTPGSVNTSVATSEIQDAISDLFSAIEFLVDDMHSEFSRGDLRVILELVNVCQRLKIVTKRESSHEVEDSVFRVLSSVIPTGRRIYRGDRFMTNSCVSSVLV